jgi:hypothetical protein
MTEFEKYELRRLASMTKETRDQAADAMKRSLDKEHILHSLTNCMAMLQVAHDHLQAMSK